MCTGSFIINNNKTSSVRLVKYVSLYIVRRFLLQGGCDLDFNYLPFPLLSKFFPRERRLPLVRFWWEPFSWDELFSEGLVWAFTDYRWTEIEVTVTTGLESLLGTKITRHCVVGTCSYNETQTRLSILI